MAYGLTVHGGFCNFSAQIFTLRCFRSIEYTPIVFVEKLKG